MTLEPPSDDDDVPRSPVPLLVIGGSAGSLQPLLELVEGLTVDLPAAVLVCQHTGENVRSHLRDILARRSALPASWAADAERLRAGHVYVASPGRHLLVSGASTRLSSGPRVNRHRPSVDVLFASAARAAGTAATAVVLSGVLDDGAVGAALVDLAGGQVFVQDPETADFASMPSAALAAAPGARVMTGETMISELVEALDRPPASRTADLFHEHVHPEVTMQNSTPDGPGFLLPGESRLTRLACPDCGGGLAQVDLPQISYFRCHTGHQYAPQTLSAAQADASEHKLWSAIAALEEQAVVQRYLEGVRAEASPSATSPGTFRRSAQELTDRAAALRKQVEQWTALTEPVTET